MSITRALLPLSCLLLLLTGLPANALEVWMGSAPFCDANPGTCHLFDLHFVRSDTEGSGSRCLKGNKVLCSQKVLTKPLTDTAKSDLVVVAYDVGETSYTVEHTGQTERTCHIPRVLTSAVPDMDVLVLLRLEMGGCLLGDLGDKTVPLAKMMENYGFAHSTSIMGENSRSFYNSNGGVVIISRWPITHAKEFVYESYSGMDSFKQKGSIFARISKKGVHYNIIGTSLQSGSRHDTRTQQAEQLADIIRELEVPDSQPVVVAGAFFTDRVAHLEQSDQLLAAMRAAIPIKIGGINSNLDYTTNTLVDSNQEAREWVDYVVYSVNHKKPDRAEIEIINLKSDTQIRFCSSAMFQPYYVSPDEPLCFKERVTLDLSDHYPVVGRFTFNSDRK